MKKRKPTDIEMQLIRLLWQALDIIRNHGADADADYIDKQLNLASLHLGAATTAIGFAPKMLNNRSPRT